LSLLKLFAIGVSSQSYKFSHSFLKSLLMFLKANGSKDDPLT